MPDTRKQLKKAFPGISDRNIGHVLTFTKRNETRYFSTDLINELIDTGAIVANNTILDNGGTLSEKACQIITGKTLTEFCDDRFELAKTYYDDGAPHSAARCMTEAATAMANFAREKNMIIQRMTGG